MQAKTKLLEIKDETHDVKSFRFEKPARFDYKPGQYVLLADASGERAFSLASSPTEDFLQISIKMTGSPFKESLLSLLGQHVEISGPFGRFILDEGKTQNVDTRVMVAGGIGITPFRSMIKYATDKKLGDKIILIYSNKTAEDIAFLGELTEIQKQNENLAIVHTLTRSDSSDYRTGRIDEKLIREIIDNIGGSIFYACGPPAFVDTVIVILKSMGVDAGNIRFERFTGY